jgi:hypothetical protein
MRDYRYFDDDGLAYHFYPRKDQIGSLFDKVNQKMTELFSEGVIWFEKQKLEVERW